MASGNTAALSGADLTNLHSCLSMLSQLQTTTGTVQDQLTQASSRIQDLQTTNTTMLGNTENVDIASVMTEYTTQQAAYQAALQATASILQKDSLMNFLN
jgi:flagellar hook-associated protein 3 FlgL